MTERTKREQDVVTNLVDAGCDNELIEQFMDLLKTGRKEAGLWEEFGAASTFLASDLVVCSYKA